jgi:hypothetical protein
MAMAVLKPHLSFAADRNSSALRITISALSTGKVLLNGKHSTVAAVRRSLRNASAKSSTVCYYRESGKGEPPLQAIEVFKLIVESKLPVSLSSKPDFSDYLDEKGPPPPTK